jgi:hypothetical protein
VERQQSVQRLAIHGCSVCQCDLCSDVHRKRRQRAIGNDGLGQGSCAHRLPKRWSECSEERRQCDPDVVGEERHLMRRLRCLVGSQSSCRHAVYRGTY